MIISWLGQACVVIKQDAATLVIDPYDPGRVGIPLPSLEAQVVLISHSHQDHDNAAGIKGKPFIVKEPGEYDVGGFFIEAIRSFHDDEGGKARGENLIFVVRAGDIRVAHFGDFGQSLLTPEQLDALSEVDVAFLPVGGFFTIDGPRAAKIAGQLEPKVVIPMHYQIPGLTIKELAGPEGFFDALGKKPDRVIDSWHIKQGDLPEEGTALFQLEPTHK